MTRMRQKYYMRGTYKGEEVEFVERTYAELQAELVRVRSSAKTALQLLSRIPNRVQHPVIRSAKYQLGALDFTRELDGPDEIADELCALSFVLMDTLELVDNLTHCRHELLERARTALRYGHAHIKKDRYSGNKKDDCGPT